MRLVVEMGEGKTKSQKLVTEDGELVEGVRSIQWKANAAEQPVVVVEMFASKVDFELGNARSEPRPDPVDEPEG